MHLLLLCLIIKVPCAGSNDAQIIGDYVHDLEYDILLSIFLDPHGQVIRGQVFLQTSDRDVYFLEPSVPPPHLPAGSPGVSPHHDRNLSGDDEALENIPPPRPARKHRKHRKHKVIKI